MVGEYVRRTAITRLRVNGEQRRLLEETLAAWTRACQLAADLAWDDCHTKTEVQSLAYEPIRHQTDLGSQHAVLATHQAAEAVTGCRDRLDNGKNASKPSFSSPTITYDARSMTLFDDGSVSLATVEDRVRCPLALPTEDDGYQYQYLDSDEWEITESTLTLEQSGGVLLHLGFRRPKTDVERETAEGGTVLGVDFGVENIAVTSTARFFSGRELVHRLREFEKTRASLQRTGTRSAHRTLQSAGERELRYIRQQMHEVSNGIIEEAKRYGCEILAIENLTDIRERTRGAWGHVWAFRILRRQLTYKADARGITVRDVPPKNTSKRCSECGHTTAENRPNREKFHCQECGSRANADYNAAKNIGLRDVRRGRQSSRRTGDSRLSLKSGAMTPNGEFIAYPQGFEAESTDKPAN